MSELNFNEHVLYVGRWQPPHKGHMTIFDQSLSQGKNICIAIRNVEPSEQNPLSAEVVKNLWEKIYYGNPSVMVIIVPNISAIKYGRNVGYSIEEIKVSDNISAISATSIRNSIKSGDDSWKQNVSHLIQNDLINYLI